MRYIISFLTASLALPAMAEVPDVVTDIPPVHSLVAQVMGDLGQPVLLLESGADVHSFQLRPSQARDLARADLVVWIGPDLTPWLDRALSGPELRLLDAAGTELREYGEADDEAGHDDHAVKDLTAEDHGDHGPAGGHDDEGHAHDDHATEGHEGHDPHAWLDPGNAALWLSVIAAELSTLDPENAATYAANAQTAAQSLTALDAELNSLLTPLADRPYVVFHDAYGYFTAHFGLHPAMAIAMGDAASPSAGHLHDLQSQLTPGTCVFPEANHDPALTATLIGDTGAKLGAALDPEGSALPPGPGLYADLLRRMASDVAACLQG